MPALKTAPEKIAIESKRGLDKASVSDRLRSTDVVVNTDSDTSNSDSSNNQNSSEGGTEDEEPVKNPTPEEIYALMSIFLGPMISQFSNEELQNIVVTLGEKITDILAVSAVLLKIPGADQNPRYQELIDSSSNNSN